MLSRLEREEADLNSRVIKVMLLSLERRSRGLASSTALRSGLPNISVLLLYLCQCMHGNASSSPCCSVGTGAQENKGEMLLWSVL